MSSIQKFNENLLTSWSLIPLSDYENEYFKKFKQTSKYIKKYYEWYVELYGYETESSYDEETDNEFEKKENKYFLLKLTDTDVVYNFKKVIESPEFDPNMVSSKKITPLMFLFNNHNEYIYDNLSLELKTIFKKNIFKITKMLIENGADVNKLPYPDYSYVCRCVQLNYVNSNTIKLIALNDRNLNAYHCNNETEICGYLLQITYTLILHKARKLDIFEFFLKNGADPNIDFYENSYNLILSCLNNTLSVLNIPYNDQDSINEMKIMSDCSELLIEYGADYNRPSEHFDKSSFFYALHHPKLIDIMLEKGLDILYISVFFNETKLSELDLITNKRYSKIFSKYIVKYTISFERNVGCYFSNDITDIIFSKLY